MGKQDIIFVDVREPEEYAAEHVRGALNIPLADIIENRAQHELTKDTRLVLYCRSGNRSGVAAKLLRRQGYDAVNGINQATIESTHPQ